MDRKDKGLRTRDPVQRFERTDYVSGDPTYDGIFICNLKKGDKIRVETAVVRGSGLIIDMELVNPQASAVSVKKVTSRTGFFMKSIGHEAIGVETPVVVVRSFRLPERTPTHGWLGLNCTMALSSATIIQPIRAIYVNGTMLFPQENTSRH